MKITTILDKINIWRGKHLTERQFLLILSFIIGIVSGSAAILLKNTIHYTHHFLGKYLDISGGNYTYIALPSIGILITVLYIHFFVKDNIGHGVSRILFAISKKNGLIKRHNSYSSMISSTFTIGFGGSVGAEAPIVLTGAAIGSNLARLFRMNYKHITLMIGCGAAGAVAGIFKAPVAGFVFTLEVLMLDLTMASMIPLLTSAVTAAVLAYFFLGHGESLYNFSITHHFEVSNIPWYIVLGVIAGLMSLYFTRMVMLIEGFFEKLPSKVHKFIIGSLALGILIFIFPPLFGEGYISLQQILSGNGSQLLDHSLFYNGKSDIWVLIGFTAMLLIFKVFATSVTTGGGGIGGVFAPSLFMGGVLGYLVALLLNQFSFIEVNETYFSLVGMAAFMSGVMHAPLTGIFLIAEITGGYGLFVPLIIGSVISYVTIMYFEEHSLYTKRLAKRGELITHNKDRAALTLMRLNNEVERDLIPVAPEDTLRRLVKTISKSKRNIFPVVNTEGELEGVVLLDDIREIIFNAEMYDKILVSELMTQPPGVVLHNDSMEKIMDIFEQTGAWNLPVTRHGKYEGFISKSKVFEAYRKMLVYFSEE